MMAIRYIRGATCAFMICVFNMSLGDAIIKGIKSYLIVLIYKYYNDMKSFLIHIF